MHDTQTEAYFAVVNGLSEMIRNARIILNRECSQPSRDPDSSDHFISQETERVKKLCQVRDDFEAIACSTSTLMP